MRSIVGIILFVLLALPQPVTASDAPPVLPATVYWESAYLAETKVRRSESDDFLQKDFAKLRRKADAALLRGPYSVMQKTEVPPSGDKHDYQSFSRYWWPSPDTPDGLPYLRRDGETNIAMRARGDRDQVGMLIEDIETLAMAYYYFEDQAYAQHASKLIRTWFLDPSTRMNPHLRYAQAVPGRSEGRGVGIIDTRGFILILDATALLASSEHFSSDDLAKLKEWFESFLAWLQTSKLGAKESHAPNNHGSWYAAQVAHIALFVGDSKTAHDVVQRVRRHHILRQFGKDGSQMEELKRTRSLHYSFFNLAAMSAVARAGEHLGIELWHAGSAKSGGMNAGFQYVVPYTTTQSAWPHPQIAGYKFSPSVVQLLRMASVRYAEPAYFATVSQVGHSHSDQNYAALQFRAFTPERESARGVSISVEHGFTPAPLHYALPDISGYSVDAVRSKLPTGREGTVRVAPTAGEPILEEIFRNDRHHDFKQRQGAVNTKVILVQQGAITLRDLVLQLENDDVASIDQAGSVTLRLPILIQPEATLIVEGKQTPVLHLSTDHGSFIANAGTLFVLQAEVSSWDEQAKKPAAYAKKTEFRPFIASYIRSKTFLAGSLFRDLGYHAPTSYGISLSSQPKRHRGPSGDWPTGILVGNEFRGLYYGFYSFEARDVAIVDNKYVDNILYGIDPHDRSTRLIIAKNTTTGTRERHGIIGSRGISDSFIFENTSHSNTGSGIMLDRQCSGNVILGNMCYDNGQGIAVYESPRNLLLDNFVARNTKSGIRVRNSDYIEIRENTVVGNGGYAFEVYAKRLDDHQKRIARGDLYVAQVGVRVHGNTASGNKRGLFKASNLGSVRMSRFTLNPEYSNNAREVPLGHMRLDTSRDRKFGSDLDRYSEELQAVFQSSHPMISVRDGRPQKVDRKEE